MGHSTATREAIPRTTPASFSELLDLALDLLAGIQSIRHVEPILERSEAAALAYLAENHRAQKLGAPSVARVADEILRIGRRTAAERVALHRIFMSSKAAEQAFLDGRLSSCQILAIAPIIRRTEGNHSSLIEESCGQSVRQLRARARTFVADCAAHEPRKGEAGVVTGPDDIEASGGEFSFTAPLPFETVWREMMDLSRRVLGYDAPQYQCLEAILAEAGVSAHDGDDDESEPDRQDGVDRPDAIARRSAVDGRDAPRHSYPVPSTGRMPHVSPSAVAFASETLTMLGRHLEDVRGLLDDGCPSDPFDALDRLRQTHVLRAPLRTILARILRALRDTRALGALGYRDARDFAESYLRISERSARGLVQESYLFEDSPLIEEAYGRGQIGIGKAFLVRRIASYQRTGEFLERARGVTLAQLRRECRFTELLRLSEPELAARFPHPFPSPELEQAMIRMLCDSHGWTPQRLATEFENRGLAWGGCVSDEAVIVGKEDSAVVDVALDPAANPIVMERLELLLDLLVMSCWDDPPVPCEGILRDGVRGEDILGDDIQVDGVAGQKRQMSAHFIGSLDSCTSIPIRFWAPDPILADLREAITRVRQDCGPATPVWVAMVVLFAQVAKEWNSQDPDSRPTREKILKRDRYHCQSPLCDSRSHLETHHLRFASQGGSDSPANLSTLCHSDHQHVIHAGHARLAGRAPHALSWSFGTRPGHEPLLVLLGSRIIGGTCA